MNGDPLPADAAALRLLRTAVDAAVAAGAAFVTPVHLLQAFAMSAGVMAPFAGGDALAAAAAAPTASGLTRLDNGAAGAPKAFERYDSLAIRSTDGTRSRWLDADTLVALREAMRVSAGGSLTIAALAAGLVLAARRDRAFATLIDGGADALAEAASALERVSPA